MSPVPELFPSAFYSDFVSSVSLQLEHLRLQAEEAIHPLLSSSPLSSIFSSISSLSSSFLFSPFSSHKDLLAKQQAAVEAAIWEDSLSVVRSLSCILWREQIDIYLTHVPPGSHVDLIRYYGQMQLRPRVPLLIGLTSFGVIPLLRLVYSNRGSPRLGLPYRVCIYTCLFLGISLCVAEILPTLFWPFFHRSMFLFGKLCHSFEAVVFGYRSGRL
eukprot:GHVS01103685.1.p1 GENE.GHVS01103685.1~~GHVS01103685.1.p1  ORF type:complete len:215 (-),score=26.63 GHVS01103685.1:170-814(-)